MSKRTPVLRIRRPESGPYAVFSIARMVAKERNAENGRGYRAIKAQDGSHAVVFRPAVANNKQRRVREVF